MSTADTTAGPPTIAATPQFALPDEPLTIRLTELPPGREITVRARRPGPPGQRLESWAIFTADGSGALDLATQAPQAGTYGGVDPMGLIWSMALAPASDEPAPGAAEPWAPTTIAFAAELDGAIIATATVERIRLATGVVRTEVRDSGLVGTLFAPAGPGPHAGIILLGGSEGGLHEPDAALLAAHGYATLALAYFGSAGVSPALVNIPLEYFGTAIHWLRDRDEIRADRLMIMGGSRGGEAALLIGATFPQVTAVVSYLGSGVITQGIAGGDILAMVNTGQSSWTWRGEPLPYLPSRATPEFAAQVREGRPVELRQVFEAALHDNEALIDAATIPVERINGPVLLISAGDDRTWPTTQLSAIAEERLLRQRHPHQVEHYRYPRAGHGIIPPPYGPTTFQIAPLPGGSMLLGGTADDDAHARADAWRQTLAFLARHLTQGETR